MNREILFRGKRVDNGEWVYGYLYQDGMIGCNIFQTKPHLAAYIVDPSTVCQYTGLTDKNGVKIFEGDVVRMHYFFENYHPVTLGAFEDESEIICKLSVTPLGVYFESANMTGYLCDYLEDPEEELEVIGNIFDNPELLEENNT